VPVPAAGLPLGLSERAVLLIKSAEPARLWQERLQCTGPVFTLPVGDGTVQRSELPYIGAACAGAAARLVGVITRTSLEQAIVEEIGKFGTAQLEKNLMQALAAFDTMAEHAGLAREGSAIAADAYASPAWVDVPLEPTSVAAPDIAAPATSAR